MEIYAAQVHNVHCDRSALHPDVRRHFTHSLYGIHSEEKRIQNVSNLVMFLCLNRVKDSDGKLELGDVFKD